MKSHFENVLNLCKSIIENTDIGQQGDQNERGEENNANINTNPALIQNTNQIPAQNSNAHQDQNEPNNRMIDLDNELKNLPPLRQINIQIIGRDKTVFSWPKL